MNLILNYLEFWTNHAPHVVHGMVHGKIVSIQNPFVFIEGVEVKSYHNAISSFRSAR
jgi:nitrous oxidase accessory protein NosD